MGDLVQAARLAVKLTEARDTLRALWRDTWPEPVRPHMELLQRVSKESGRSVLDLVIELATRAADAGDGMGALMILAAAVELIEPTASTTSEEVAGA